MSQQALIAYFLLVDSQFAAQATFFLFIDE
jgi:hypothetical protein